MFETQISNALVIHTGANRISLEDILETMRGWYAHPDFDADRPVLWDLSAATIEATEEQIAAWAEAMLTATNENRAGRKTAWVLPTSDIARMAVDLLSSYDFQNKVRIYQNDREAAEAWLTTTIR